jgi:hypothetical protein
MDPSFPKRGWGDLKLLSSGNQLNKIEQGCYNPVLI